jgi:hypothetical protein
METYYRVLIEIEEIEIDDQLRVSCRTIDPLLSLRTRFDTETDAIDFVTQLGGWR